MDTVNFRRKPILGILRGVSEKCIEPLIETVICAGLETLEITMNTAGAPELIRTAKRVAGGRLALGAGTVLTMNDLTSALESGASFIVTPVLVRDVIEYCVRSGIAVFPGAFTPGEIHQAHEAGATMVKVFPANFFGPEYIKQIRGPFKHIQLLACGGVTLDNLGDYFSSGVNAVSFGASVFREEWLVQGDYAAIACAVRGFLDAWKRSAVFGEKK